MEKKIIFSLLAGTMLGVMPSCTDLDETVYDNLPADTFGSTETEVNALVGTVYKTLKSYASSGDFLALDEQSGSGAVTPTRKGGDW